VANGKLWADVRNLHSKVGSNRREEERRAKGQSGTSTWKTAKRECRTCLDKWEGQIERLRQLVEDSDGFAPDALRMSFQESMPDMQRAARATIARLQILVQIRAGHVHYAESEEQDD
jgi:hypothetical protein